MSIYKTAVNKPITTMLAFVALAILGVFSLTKLPIDLYPEFETNSIMVITSYPGASSSDIENNVSRPLENVLNAVSNLKHITSKSNENISIISLTFNEGTDINVATNDVRDKLDMVTNQLPDGANKPMLFRFGADDIPIVIMSVQAKESTRALNKILDNDVKNTLGRLDGVGGITIMGPVKREIQVYCDPIKLEAYHIPIEQISRIIMAENRTVSAGLIDIGKQTTALRVEGEISDPKELEDIVISSINGRNVYLKDVARVEDSQAERSQEVYNNGVQGAMIVINKQSGANSVKIASAIKKEMPIIQKQLPPDVKLGIIFDTSENINKTISSLEETIYITFFVVVLVVLFFLGRWRATFIICLTIPVSLVGSFIYLLASGNTLNIISLSSLSIAIGMVVDDAIVVLENITTHIERGSYPKQAAIHATNEVGISVIASTLTMLAVFLPLTMVGGMTGILFRQLGWIVSIIMIISTVAALSLTPMLSSQLLRRTKVNNLSKSAKIFAPIERMLKSMENIYVRTLKYAVTHRKTIITSAVVIFAASIFCAPMVKTEFFPMADNSFISLTAELPAGTAVEETRDLAQTLYKEWTKDNPEIKLCNYSLGQADADNTFASMNKNGTNVLSFNVKLVDPLDRKRSMQEVAESIRQSLKRHPAIKTFQVNAGGNKGGAGGQPTVDLEIYGYDFHKTDELAGKFKEAMLKFPSCSQVTVSREDYVPNFQVDFDRKKLAENGLNVSTAALALRNQFNGAESGYFREDGDEYKIMVRLNKDSRRSLQDVENTIIYTPQGRGIRLCELGKVREEYMPPTIERKDRQRIVTVSGVVAKGKALSDLVAETQSMMKKVQLPDGISYKVGGTYEDQQKSFGDLGSLLILIILLVFIVMAAEFESLRDPFVIMFSIPFAFTGVIFGLLLTNTTLSVMALIGLIMLMGIVVKNGIVLIDYIRLCRERGNGIKNSVVMSGKSRLRPVLMTTATTVLGLLPMAIGIGQGSEMWKPMGIAVVSGLVVSTLITLILIPTIYTTVLAMDTKKERKKLVKKHELKERLEKEQQD